MHRINESMDNEALVITELKRCMLRLSVLWCGLHIYCIWHWWHYVVCVDVDKYANFVHSKCSPICDCIAERSSQITILFEGVTCPVFSDYICYPGYMLVYGECIESFQMPLYCCKHS